MLTKCILCEYKPTYAYGNEIAEQYVIKHIITVHVKKTFIQNLCGILDNIIYGKLRGFSYEIQLNPIISQYTQMLFVNPVNLNEFCEILFDSAFPDINRQRNGSGLVSHGTGITLDKKLFKLDYYCSICENVYDCGFPTLEVAIMHVRQDHSGSINFTTPLIIFAAN